MDFKGYVSALFGAVCVLAACSSAPKVTPPPSAASVDTSSMSLAARRFDQFCVSSIGTGKDGVERANAFYGKSTFANLGQLKVSGDIKGEDIGVQYDTARRGCMVTTASGKSPNGAAELKALAEAYAARKGGTVQAHSSAVITVHTPQHEINTAKFQFWDARNKGTSFLVEQYWR